MTQKRSYFRMLFWIGWVVSPVIALAWHFGPGQNQFARDVAGDHVLLASEDLSNRQYQASAEKLSAALAALPAGDLESRNRLRLEHARTRIQAGDIIAGQEELEKLLQEVVDSGQSDSQIAVSVRHELAAASYFAAWLMRREGATADEWKPEAERSRQQFRLLAEQGKDKTLQEQFQKNLEATIRLEQMDLDELLARPLPKNCPCNCKNLSQRKRKQCQSRCQGKKPQQGKGKKKEKKDARKQLKKERGAGINATGGKGS